MQLIFNILVHDEGVQLLFNDLFSAVIHQISLRLHSLDAVFKLFLPGSSALSSMALMFELTMSRNRVKTPIAGLLCSLFAINNRRNRAIDHITQTML